MRKRPCVIYQKTRALLLVLPVTCNHPGGTSQPLVEPHSPSLRDEGSDHNLDLPAAPIPVVYILSLNH